MSLSSPHCRKHFLHSKQLRVHVRNHTDKAHKCPKCSFSTTSVRRLDSHQKARVHDPPAKCSQCKFTSCTSFGLGLHRNHVHKKANSEKQQDRNSVLRVMASRTKKLDRAGVKIKRAVARIRSSPPKARTSPSKIKTSPAKRPRPEAGQIHSKDEPKNDLKPETIVFSCPYCDFRSPLPEDIRSHMPGHAGIKPYKCEACPYKTGIWRLLKRHVSVHTQLGEVYSCKTCGKAYSTKGNVQRHSKVHFQKKSVNVTAAGKLMKRSKLAVSKTSTLRNHRDAGDKLYTCSQCDYACRSTSRLTYHIRRNHTTSSLVTDSDSIFKCLLCPYSDNDKFGLQRHVQSVHGYPCKLCDFKAHSGKQLERHLRLRHEDGSIEDTTATNDTGINPGRKEVKKTSLQSIKCPLCDFTCSSKQFLSKHSVVHSQEKKYDCTYCPYNTTRKKELIRHEQIHTG